MAVTNMRIDDRLIHGQIVTAWIADSNAKMIVVSDNAAASDPTQQMLLKLTVPAGIKLEIKKISETKDFIESRNENILLLVRNPKAALELVDSGFKIDRINVGNISNSKSVVGRSKLLAFIYVEPDDVESLKKLNSYGIKLEIRAVPNDKPIDGIDLLEKNNL